MIAEEMKEKFEGKMAVEYWVNKQAVEKRPATKSPEEIQQMLDQDEYYMELLLVYKVKEWEQLFWNKFFLKLFWTRLAMIEWKRKKDGRKNAPASECRTYTQLVSLAFGRKKKNGTP